VWGEVLDADTSNAHLAAAGVWPEPDEVFYVMAAPVLSLVSYLSSDMPGRDADGVWDAPTFDAGVKPAPWPVAVQLRLPGDGVSEAVWVEGFPEDLSAPWGVSASLTNTVGRVPVVVDPVSFVPSCGDWADAVVVASVTLEVSSAGVRRVNPVIVEDGFCYSAMNTFEVMLSGVATSVTEPYGVPSQTVMVWAPLPSIRTAQMPAAAGWNVDGSPFAPIVGAGELPDVWLSEAERIYPGDGIADTVWLPGVPETLPVGLDMSAEVTSVLGSVPVVFDENDAPHCPDWGSAQVTIVSKVEHVSITAAGLSRVNPFAGTLNGFCYSYSAVATVTVGGRSVEVREDFGTPSQTVMVWRALRDMHVSASSQALVDGRSGNIGLLGQKIADSILPADWPTDADVPAGTPVSATVVSFAYEAAPVITDAGGECAGIDWSDPMVASLVNTTEPLVLTRDGLQGVGEFTSDPDTPMCYSFGYLAVFVVAGEVISVSEPPGNPSQTVMTWPAPTAAAGGSVADSRPVAGIVFLLLFSGATILCFARKQHGSS
jgi:hypothetical protein